MILIKNRQRKIAVDSNHLELVIKTMIKALGYEGFDVGILLTTNNSIRTYNAEFRNKDKATDILSFPYHTELKAGEKIKVTYDEDKNLGDIIISLEYVMKKAIELERSFEEHLVILLAHGLAHLLNYDHITDADYIVMQKIEDKLLRSVQSIKK